MDVYDRVCCAGGSTSDRVPEDGDGLQAEGEAEGSPGERQSIPEGQAGPGDGEQLRKGGQGREHLHQLEGSQTLSYHNEDAVFLETPDAGSWRVQGVQASKDQTICGSEENNLTSCRSVLGLSQL